MNFNDYLLKRLGSLSASDKSLSKLSTFGKFDATNSSSIFSLANTEELSNIDYEKILGDSDESALATGDDKDLATILKEFLQLEDVKKAADADGDGELSVDEAQAYLGSIAGKDGDAASLSTQDLDKVIEELGIDLEDIASQSIQDAVEGLDDEVIAELDKNEKNQAIDETNSFNPTSQAGSVGGGAGRSSGVSNGYGSSSASKANQKTGLDAMSLSELETEKTKRQDAVQEKQDAVNAINSGENEKVKAAKEEMDKAKEAYEKALDSDKNVPQELKTKQKDNTKSIETNQSNIDKNEIEITKKETAISGQENTVNSAKSELSSLQSSLSSLPSPTGKDEDKDKDAEIASKKESIQKQITSKEKEVEEQTQKLDEEKEDLKKLNEKKTTLEKEKTDLEKAKADIQAQIEKTCSAETKEAMKTYNEAKANVDTVKQQELKTAKADLDDAKTSLKEVSDKITEVKNKEMEQKNSVSTSNLPDGLFDKNGSILKGKEDLVAKIADKYGIEPEFLASIISLESGYGTSALAQNNNNFGGVTGSGDAGYTVRSSDGYKFAKYSSVEAGLDAMAKNLASYSDRFSDVNSVDITNVAAIGGHYCVGGDWANKVSSIYKSIKGKA